MYGHTEVVKLLTKKGADIHMKNYNDDTSLYVASDRGRRTEEVICK